MTPTATSKRYQLRPGFIGPLDQRRAIRRQQNHRRAAAKKAARAVAAICPITGGAHDYLPWDCGCSFGCGHCRYVAQCRCGALR